MKKLLFAILCCLNISALYADTYGDPHRNIPNFNYKVDSYSSKKATTKNTAEEQAKSALTISGEVADDKRNALKEVTVSLVSHSADNHQSFLVATAKTGNDGKYTLTINPEDLRGGKLTIKFECNGFKQYIFPFDDMQPETLEPMQWRFSPTLTKLADPVAIKGEVKLEAGMVPPDLKLTMTYGNEKRIIEQRKVGVFPISKIKLTPGTTITFSVPGFEDHKYEVGKKDKDIQILLKRKLVTITGGFYFKNRIIKEPCVIKYQRRDGTDGQHSTNLGTFDLNNAVPTYQNITVTCDGFKPTTYEVKDNGAKNIEIKMESNGSDPDQSIKDCVKSIVTSTNLESGVWGYEYTISAKIDILGGGRINQKYILPADDAKEISNGNWDYSGGIKRFENYQPNSTLTENERQFACAVSEKLKTYLIETGKLPLIDTNCSEKSGSSDYCLKYVNTRFYTRVPCECGDKETVDVYFSTKNDSPDVASVHVKANDKDVTINDTDGGGIRYVTVPTGSNLTFYSEGYENYLVDGRGVRTSNTSDTLLEISMIKSSDNGIDARVTLRGTVTDDDGAPLNNITVSVNDQNASTDENGKFEIDIKNVEIPGTITLKYADESEQYDEQIKHIKLTRESVVGPIGVETMILQKAGTSGDESDKSETPTTETKPEEPQDPSQEELGQKARDSEDEGDKSETPTTETKSEKPQGPSQEELEQKARDSEDAYNAAKEKQNSAAQRLLTATTTLATSEGAMAALSARSEQRIDEEAEQDMSAYLQTFRCDYGKGVYVPYGPAVVDLPGGNDLLKYYTEYAVLANRVKATKQALNLKLGIESEVILDKAEGDLYSYNSGGPRPGAYASLARALTDANSADAAVWAKQKSDSKEKFEKGAIAAVGGLAVGIGGNLLLNSGKDDDTKLQRSLDSATYGIDLDNLVGLGDIKDGAIQNGKTTTIDNLIKAFNSVGDKLESGQKVCIRLVGKYNKQKYSDGISKQMNIVENYLKKKITISAQRYSISQRTDKCSGGKNCNVIGAEVTDCSK